MIIDRVPPGSPRSKQSTANDLACIFAVVLLVHAILRGVRAPNLWAATHFLFNYDFGFVKRGLAGTLISLAGLPYLYTYNFVFYCSVGLLLANALLLIIVARRGMLVGGTAFQVATLVYFSSVAVVFLAHTIGYFDHVALLIALIAITIGRFDLRFGFVALCLPLSILLHEPGFIVFGPVIMYVFLLDASRRPTYGRIVCCILLAITAVTTFVVAAKSNLPAESAEAMYHQLATKSAYPLRRDAVEVLSRDLHATLALMAEELKTRFHLAVFVLSLIVTLPTTAFLLRSSIRALAHRKDRRLLIAAACVASLSPMLLHVVAWDSARWNTLAITTSYLVLVATVLHDVPATRAVEPDARRATNLVAAVLMGFGLASTVPLFDGYRVQPFPYIDHVVYLLDLISGNETFPPTPPDR